MLRRFAGLAAPRRRFLIEALVVATAVRTALRLGSWRRVRGWLDRAGRAAGRPDGPDRVEGIRWAARTASDLAPGRDTCLVRSVTAAVLLVRRGRPASLQVGVEPVRGGRLDAHMWVESDDRIVVGRSGADEFDTRLPPIEIGRL